MADRKLAALLRGVLQLFRARSWAQRILAGVVVVLALAACLPQLGEERGERGEKGKPQRGAVLSGEVVGVADGDTVTLLTPDKTEYRLRLAYIDSPEKKQAFGQQAKKALSDLVYRRQIEATITDVDRYGRGVALLTQDGRAINLAQVESGHAWFYRQYAKKALSRGEFARYAAAEDAARQAQQGLWRDRDPTPPWEWRKQQREGR
ncbi:thermonuclease family protein [Chitinilyticum litopenaei]|uniref:thermonuclease family protein n=1 Tax=Chitinilyticum litopenaei TaxID=1121276 RepID=UPI0004081552|nr:thermonuclease family protein [Chitinilyticum litopenaei]